MKDQTSTAPHHGFAATRWTLVLRARGESADAQAGLGELCTAYWKPVFRFLQREGRTEDAAREETQEFFARLLKGGQLDGFDPSRGRFRAFLLGAVKHFLADTHDHANRLKRGGGVQPESLDALSPSQTTTVQFQVLDRKAIVSDGIFDREWALTVMENALTLVQRELAAEGKQNQFDALKPWLAGDGPGVTQAETARELGISENAVKVLVHRLRKRFRERVRNEISHTVSDPSAVQEELRYLVEVLSLAQTS